MSKLIILDPTESDKIGTFRGGSRMLQLLKENLPEAEIINSGYARSSLTRITNNQNNIILNLTWSPFFPLINYPSSSLNASQFLFLYDLIPLKFAKHFPAGIKGNFNLWKNKRALKNYQKILTISNHSKQDIIDILKIPEEKVKVIYPCLSKIFTKTIDKTSLKLHVSRYKLQEKRFALYVGDVNWNKNLVNIAKAVIKANITCVFVGKMFSTANRLQAINARKIHLWLKQYQQFFEIIEKDRRFILLDYVTDNELVELYQQTACNLLVSYDEGFGMSYIEAASQACPSVLADREIFHETAAKTALFADPTDPNDIADKINSLYFNQHVRDNLGRKAQEYVLDKYSPEKFKKTILSLLNPNN